MEDYMSGEEDYNDGTDEDYYEEIEIENDDSDSIQRGPSCKVIPKESLLVAQWDDLRKVMDMLCVREHHARTLLIHYQWNVNKLFEVLGEKGKAYLFSGAGVTVGNHDLNSFPHSAVMCAICMEDVPYAVLTKMDCGHCFCNDCWTEHFIVKIKEGQSKRIRCMTHKCNAICDETIVRSLVRKRHPDLVEKFNRFLLESYIEDNKMVKWCPSVPHCGNAIRVEFDEFCEVECSCGFQFCFRCMKEAHSPCLCLMWELWLNKCRDESKNANWMTAYTKPCPKCYKLVEKNGGCNLVVCICGQAFCWLCGGPTGRAHTWMSISGHSCGRFKQNKEMQDECAKRDLYRYMHYHNRYKAHTDSFRHESSLKDKIEDKVTKLESCSKYRDCSWITNALYMLFRWRRVLSYSYPFAFYMFGEELFRGEMNEKQRKLKQDLFEDQQQQLEQNVERLSKFMEMEFDSYDDDQIKDIRMQIINLTAVIDICCKKMYECIENDLLDSLQFSAHNIAPYCSKGIEKADELSTSFIQNVSNVDTSPLDCETFGLSEEADCPSRSKKSEDTESRNLKCAKRGNQGKGSWTKRFCKYYLQRLNLIVRGK